VNLDKVGFAPPCQIGDHKWIAAFLKALAREDIAPVTVRGYRSDLGLFVSRPAICPLPPT
jgi:hypothetical protein